MKKSSPSGEGQYEFDFWEKSIRQGGLPTRDQLKALLREYPNRVLPEGIRHAVILGIDGKLKATRGRKRTPYAGFKWWVLKRKYERTRGWLQQREKRSGLRGWSLVRGKDWWSGPPHVRAARFVIAKCKLRMDVAAFLNRISSQ
jgi:hypothetical protein